MKRNAYLAATLVALLCGAALVFSSMAQTGSLAKHAFTPRFHSIRSGTSICASRAQLAVLEGNPGAMSGDYTVRLKMPDGYRIAPHTGVGRVRDVAFSMRRAKTYCKGKYGRATTAAARTSKRKKG
jgi:hypothetical protein